MFLKMNMACHTIATSTTNMKFKYKNGTTLGILSTSLVDTSHVVICIYIKNDMLYVFINMSIYIYIYTQTYALFLQ